MHSIMYNYYTTILVRFRVLKETMRGNVTKTHPEDVSLCALFLMDASKKVYREFKTQQSTAHTVRDAERDIYKLTTSLLENKVTTESTERNSPPFADPTDTGYKIATTSWIADTLLSTGIDDLQLENNGTELVTNSQMSFDLHPVMTETMVHPYIMHMYSQTYKQ